MIQLQETLKMGRKLAEYFVYYCSNGEHYVALVDCLREAKTRSELLTTICILLRYGRLHLKQGIDGISQKKLDELYQFIREGKKEEVSRFHSSLITYVSTFELENMRQQERYLLELLT